MPDRLAANAAGTPRVALGFDYGTRRIGIAAGDTLTNGARPLGVVAAHRGEPDWAQLDRFLREWAPSVPVVGVP